MAYTSQADFLAELEADRADEAADREKQNLQEVIALIDREAGGKRTFYSQVLTYMQTPPEEKDGAVTAEEESAVPQEIQAKIETLTDELFYGLCDLLRKRGKVKCATLADAQYVEAPKPEARKATAKPEAEQITVDQLDTENQKTIAISAADTLGVVWDLDMDLNSLAERVYTQLPPELQSQFDNAADVKNYLSLKLDDLSRRQKAVEVALTEQGIDLATTTLTPEEITELLWGTTIKTLEQQELLFHGNSAGVLVIVEKMMPKKEADKKKKKKKKA